MNYPELPRWKWFELPVLTLHGSTVDISPLVGLAVMLAVGLYGFFYGKRKTLWRIATMAIATGVFVVGVRGCMCIIRGWIFGIQMVGYDDIMAFMNIQVAVGLIVIGLIGGEFFCGWMCPVGGISEVIGRAMLRLKRKLNPSIVFALDLVLSVFSIAVMSYLAWKYAPSNFFYSEFSGALFVLATLVLLPAIVIFPWLDRKIRWVRHLSLGLRLLILLLGVYATNPGCTLYENEIDYSSLISLVGVFLASLVVIRAYCRYMCPFGALFSLFSSVAIVKVEPRSTPCPKSCNNCAFICPTGALDRGTIDPSLCERCGRCFEHCKSKASIDLPLPEAEHSRGGQAVCKSGPGK